VSPREWDEAARAKGVDIDDPEYMPAAQRAMGNVPRPPGPSRHPSPRCESGKRLYCTCDTCF